MGAESREDLVWCAADPHFHAGDPALPVFLRWLGAFDSSGTATLVLLGDLFQVWLGMAATGTPEQDEVLSALGSLTAKGRKVVYLAGNRDYFVEGPALKAGMSVAESWEIRTGGALVHFEHGDLINTSDLNYMRWREISRAGAVRALVNALPFSWQQALARRLEADLAGTNAAYKSYDPVRELEVWAERLRRRGVGLAVLGHFHVNRTVRAAGVTVRFVPQFREDGMHLRLDASGRTSLLAFNGS